MEPRAKWKNWSEAEDKMIWELCQGRSIRTDRWEWVAANFEGRSSLACRQRWLFLRRKAQGLETPRKVRERRANGRLCRVASDDVALAAIAAAPVLSHTSLTAAFFRDPLPGRSALDQKRAGIVDQAGGMRGVREAPPITLATEPMR